jgi:hypothetical protein
MLPPIPGHQSPELVSFAAALYARRHEGRVVPGGKAWLDDPVTGRRWLPLENDCHANVNTFVHHHPEYRAVRGWLYFDLMNMMPWVMFNPHSVIEMPNGKLVDITPAPKASQRYPFIRDLRDEADFHTMVESHELVTLYHFK